MTQDTPSPESLEQPESTAAAEQAAAEAANEAALRETRTSVNRKWLFKMVIIAGVAIFMAGFFLVDGAIRYPARGAAAAEYTEFQYLQVYDAEHGGIAGLQGVDDPAKRLAQLEEKLKSTGKLDAVDDAQKAWFENLALINQLGPKATAIPRKNYNDGVEVTSAQTRLESLTKAWTTTDGGKRKSPTPLSAFDIPSQWAGMALSFIIGVWVLLVVVRAKSKVYRWKLDAHQLTLPGGQTLVPDDIDEVDKRKWDKLYVSLVIKPSHPTLGGKSIAFDLLRYIPLEVWILNMEEQLPPPPETADDDKATRDPSDASTAPSAD